MRCLFAAAILVLAPIACFGQTAEVAKSEPRKRNFFSWVSDMFAPRLERQRTSTAAMIDAQRILRRDNQREEAKEKAHWEALREEDVKKIAARTRSESEAKLLIARERGRALAESLAPPKTNSAPSEALTTPQDAAAKTPPKASGDEPVAHTAPPPPPAEKAPAPQVSPVADTKAEAREAAQNTAEAVDETTVGAPSRNGPKISSVLLALVTIFLVPSAAMILLVLAVLSLRGGHRLQAAVLGGAGCVLALLVVAAAQPPPDNADLLSRLRAECERDAVRLSGYVEDITEDVVVIDDVKGAETDEHGSAVVVTEKRPPRGGERWNSRGYPIGKRSALNALGMRRPMPAYADNLETAVEIRADEETRLREAWWQGLARYLRENLGTEPQRLITLK